MIAKFLALVFFAAQAPAQPAPQEAPAADALLPLPADQQGAIRCSAAFALVAERQRHGDEAALVYPPVGERGREFFVRTGARLMDETGMTRDAVEARLRAQAGVILAEGSLDEIMPACLMLLDASGL
ncbi:hypothetical protein I5L01_12980 [Erythrobacter sp. YJ-T3-07]|uniref:hypothetical protein n=1 Tax=Erythrobacter sp. YJ-T3-07 TaxID=2793063 RepID=UPI0018D4A6AF|nr:hypothetical protein [Erythrobacter sp. YJ-T3-07]MBH1945137.1 hypothetical protein [Erythrobacter sp. YJ-T3-07]